MNLPDYNFLSAPLWLITVLHLVTLTAHFIAMNFVLGGIVTLLFGRFTGGWQHPTVEKYVKLLPSVMAMTITLAVAPLLFVQLVYSKQVYAAAIISGWFWLGIVAVVMIIYYLLYAASFDKEQTRNKTLLLGLVLAGLGYVSIVHSSVFSMAESPELMKTLYTRSQSGWLLNPDVGSYIVRWLHMISGAVTVGGFFVGLIGRDNDEAFATGRKFFLWGMATAALLGFIYLFTLGEDLLAFMRTPAIWALTLGIVLSAGSLHFFFKKKFTPAAIMLFTSVFTMVISRHYVRLIRLEDYFQPSSLTVTPQWGLVSIFLVCFVVALGLIWYMLHLFFKKAEA